MEISNQRNIAQSLAIMSQKATAILPDLGDINYLFTQNNSFFQSDFNKMSASEFASCYQFVHDEQRAVLIKTVGDLEIIKKIIIPVKSNNNLMFSNGYGDKQKTTPEPNGKSVRIKNPR